MTLSELPSGEGLLLKQGRCLWMEEVESGRQGETAWGAHPPDAERVGTRALGLTWALMGGRGGGSTQKVCGALGWQKGEPGRPGGGAWMGPNRTLPSPRPALLTVWLLSGRPLTCLPLPLPRTVA